MHEPLHLLALLAAGTAAGFINILAGGGSLLTMPLLIFFGLPDVTANGTIRVGILLQNAAAFWRYRKAGVVDGGLASKLLPPGLLGAAMGALLASHLDDSGFRVLLSGVMLICAVLVVINPIRADDNAPSQLKLTPLRVWAVLLVAGFYGGLIQAGVGYLFLAGFTFVLGFDLVKANVWKVIVVGSYTPIALGVFVFNGKVDWVYGGVLAVGQMLGATLGASQALKRGAGLIRVFLVVAVVASATKLFGLW